MRTPPLAAEHLRAARAGFAPGKAILVYDGWDMRRIAAQHKDYWRALMPEDANPADYDWSWVAGFDVLILAWATKRLIALGDALAAMEPRSMYVCIPCEGGPILASWRKDLLTS